MFQSFSLRSFVSSFLKWNVAINLCPIKQLPPLFCCLPFCSIKVSITAHNWTASCCFIGIAKPFVKRLNFLSVCVWLLFRGKKKNCLETSSTHLWFVSALDLRLGFWLDFWKHHAIRSNRVWATGSRFQ